MRRTVVVGQAEGGGVEAGPPLPRGHADGPAAPGVPAGGGGGGGGWGQQDRGVRNLTEDLETTQTHTHLECMLSWVPEFVCACVCACVRACVCVLPTLSRFSIMISTTMFWNLMFIMAATVSSCDLIRVGPNIMPRLDTVMRFCTLWVETLQTQHPVNSTSFRFIQQELKTKTRMA